MDVFVSHITEESEVAKAMKDWIESTFLGQYEVFVSSDSQSIPNHCINSDENGIKPLV